MHSIFLSLNFSGQPVYFMLVYLMLFSFTPSTAQKKVSTKTNSTKLSNKRVIYGDASFYANKFDGRKTASGEIFSQSKFTCACNMLPLGTWVRITNVRNGKSVEVRVNDRLHPKMRRVADLSKAAANKLGYTRAGVVRVKVEVIGKTRPA